MTESSKTNPYLVALVVIGSVGLGAAFILASLSATSPTSPDDLATSAALLGWAQILLVAGIGGVLGALIVAGSRWQRPPT
ncbi:hypothetical protein [Pseudolysinimonas sp.]|jgi:hypothetical protein|uniref:hypothetical protein n=1 Tax=Pseudolysinimonas sp. TaxID=2680009 RepID=UPI0037839A63